MNESEVQVAARERARDCAFTNDNPNCETYSVWLMNGFRLGFAEGAIWQAQQPPTDAEIEAAAAAMYETRDDVYDDTEWEDCDSADRERWYCYARAALEAVRRTR